MKIKTKLIIVLLLVFVSFSMVLHLYLLPRYQSEERSEMMLNEKLYLELLASNMVTPLLTSDFEQLYILLDKVKKSKKNWMQLEVYDSEKRRLYPLDSKDADQINNSVLKHIVVINGKKLGEIHAYPDFEAMLKSKQDLLKYIELALIAIILAFSVLIYHLLGRWVGRPLNNLSRAIDKVANGNYRINLATTSRDEIGVLSNTFKLMRDRLEERENELQDQHRILDIIRDTQTNFIKRETKQELFEKLLSEVIDVTGSKLGMICEIVGDKQGEQLLLPHAASGLSGEDDCLDELMERIVQDKDVYIINKSLTKHKGDQNLQLNNFMGIPLISGGGLVGVMVVANRKDDYADDLLIRIYPLVTMCSNIIEALKANRLREEAESDLQKNMDKMNSIVETAADGIIVFNKDLLIEDANMAICDIFGFDKLQLKNWSLNKLVQHQDLESIDLAIAEGGQKDKDRIILRNHEVTGIKQDELFPLEISISRLDLGETKYMAILRDISDRKRIDRMKMEFVSTVSHELRTPLTSIKGSLGLLAGGALGEFPGQASNMIKLAYDNCERLGRLVNDILDIEKIESGKMEFYPSETDLNMLMSEAVQGNRAYADGYGVELFLEPVPVRMIEVDKDRIRQVLDNLISNAIKFSDKGDVVTIKVMIEQQGIRIEVSDNGPGISESFRPHIFKKFSQSDSSDTRKNGGTGLGLSISKAIIEAHGGEIGYISEENCGATFYIVLDVVNQMRIAGEAR